MRIPAKLNKTTLLNALVRHERARANALFVSIGEGVIVTDARGRISKINAVGAHILGYSEAELLGQWYPSAIVAENSAGRLIKNINRPITRVFLSGKSVNAHLYYRHKDGSRLAVSLTVSPVMLRGRPVGAIEVFRDISQELALTQAKDEFISIASHQLRTPATGVKQYLGMVLEGYSGELTADQRLLLNKAYQSNERQLKVIDDLLKVARVDSGEIKLRPVSTDILELLKDVIHEQLQQIKKRGQAVKFLHDEESIQVDLDPARIRMVFENLLDNASKYSDDDKTLRVGVTRDSSQVTVAVEDEGIGIVKEGVTKLFQKFTRLDQQPRIIEGSGLGLYWAKKIVDLHGGSINVTSTPNKGSVFTVVLPLKFKQRTS